MGISIILALSEISNAAIPGFCETPLTVDSVNSFGDTPLHIAAIWGRVDIAEALLKAGIDINKCGENRFTALHEAVSQGHAKMVLLLLEHGADPSLMTDLGSTFDLAEANKNPAINEILQEHKMRTSGCT
jgi:ankyrin repeat protein